MYSQRNNSASTVNSKIDAKLSDIVLVEIIKKKLPKVPFGKKLVVTGNITGRTNIRGTGIRPRIPLFETGYIVSMGTFDVKVMNPESSNGRYEQNMGVGGDISLSLKIRFRVADDPESMAKFLRQQETYKNAIKTASENVMKNVIQNQKEILESLAQPAGFSDIRLDDVELKQFIDALNDQNTNAYGQAIALEAINLRYNYGIELLKVNFVDVDMPERMKNIIAEELEAQKKREIAEADAENRRRIAEEDATNRRNIEKADATNRRNIEKADAKVRRELEKLDSKNQIDISENKGEASKIELEKIVKMFQQNGFSNEQIGIFLERTYGVKYLPQGSNVIYGVNSGNVSFPIMPNTTSVSDDEPQISDGRSR